VGVDVKGKNLQGPCSSECFDVQQSETWALKLNRQTELDRKYYVEMNV